MQKKLSKLQKMILIYIFENQHEFKNNNGSLENIVKYKDMGKKVAEDFNKLIPSNREGVIVSPSFSASLSNSICALIKRGLIIKYNRNHPFWHSEILISLTEEGNETATVLNGLTP